MRDEVVAAVQSVKPDAGDSANSDDVNGWLKRLQVLRDSDPGQFQRLAARIEQFLATATPAAPATPRRVRAATKRGRT